MNTRMVLYWLLIFAGLLVAAVSVTTNWFGFGGGAIMGAAGIYFLYRERQNMGASDSE